MKAWSHKKLHVNPKFVGLCLDMAKQNLSGQKRYTYRYPFFLFCKGQATSVIFAEYRISYISSYNKNVTPLHEKIISNSHVLCRMHMYNT